METDQLNISHLGNTTVQGSRRSVFNDCASKNRVIGCKCVLYPKKARLSSHYAIINPCSLSENINCYQGSSWLLKRCRQKIHQNQYFVASTCNKAHQLDRVICLLDTMVHLPGVGDKIQRIDTMATIPEGAIILRDEDVFDYQMSRLKKWKPLSEVWPLTWGPSILAGCAAFSGCLLHFHYRTKWLLGPKGRGAYLPAALIPAALNSLLHEELILSDILMGHLKCPTCSELKSAVLHTATSVFFPLAITHLYNDIKRRDAQNEIPTKRLFKFLKTPQKTRNLLLPLFIAQFLAGMFVARYEGYTYFTILMRPGSESQE